MGLSYQAHLVTIYLLPLIVHYLFFLFISALKNLKKLKSLQCFDAVGWATGRASGL